MKNKKEAGQALTFNKRFIAAGKHIPYLLDSTAPAIVTRPVSRDQKKKKNKK